MDTLDKGKIQIFGRMERDGMRLHHTQKTRDLKLTKSLKLMNCLCLKKKKISLTIWLQLAETTEGKTVDNRERANVPTHFTLDYPQTCSG